MIFPIYLLKAVYGYMINVKCDNNSPKRDDYNDINIIWIVDVVDDDES